MFTSRLGDLIDVVHGYAYPGADFSEDAQYPTVVTPANFAVGGGFKDAKLKTFSGSASTDYVLSPGDLVVIMTDLSRDGDTLGLPAVIPKGRTYLHNQRIGLVRVIDPSRVSATYLHYYLRTDPYRSFILSGATGSTVRHTSPSRIRDFKATLPDRSRQDAIVDVLGAFDDKIAANAALARTADDLAGALFAKLLPSTWRTAPVLELATVVLGGTPSRDTSAYWVDGTVPWINSGAANARAIHLPNELITEEALKNSAAKLMPRRATVIAITGATLGQVARLEIDASGNQSLIGIWSGLPELNDWIYYAVQERLPEILGHATGAAQQHINKQVIERLVLNIPSDEDLGRWGSAVRPLLDRAAAADKESTSLVELRDTLLPHLMSGRLTVRDAEKTVSDAV